MKPIRNKVFFFDVVFFLVEDELYKVPKKPFIENPHPPFSDIFFLPPPKDEITDAEGTSEENPIILEQILKVDFERFLSVLLVNPPFQATKFFESLAMDDWISVLKLSTQWHFIGLRKLAIHYLSSNKDMTNVDRIVLAQQYGVARWFLEGIIKAACDVDQEIIHFDAERLGLHTTVSIYHMKGAVRRGSSFGQKTSTLTSIFSEFFSDEFRFIQHKDDEYESMASNTDLKKLQEAVQRMSCSGASQSCSMECKLTAGWLSMCQVVDGKLLFSTIT